MHAGDRTKIRRAAGPFGVAFALVAVGCGDPQPLLGGEADASTGYDGSSGDDGGGCVGTRPCNSYSCCGFHFTVCASCYGGKWVWPIDDNCHFACKDTGTRPGCQKPLPSTFDTDCVAAAAKSGSTACDTEMIEAMMNCFGSGDGGKCAAAKKKAPECATCALTTWIRGGMIDSAACVALVDPVTACGRIARCAADCVDLVCPIDECDMSTGSGSSGTSEWLDCRAAAEKGAGDGGLAGACAARAKDRDGCMTPKTAVCFPRTVDDLRVFLRGACRDNGHWPTDADETGAGGDTAGETGDATSEAASDSSGD